jgi:hypothetical protein
MHFTLTQLWKGGFAALGVVALMTSAEGAMAQSSKATASISTLKVLEGKSGSRTETAWTPINVATIRTANQKDLTFDAALQCGLVTDTTVRSKGGNKDGANAVASVRVRIKIEQADGVTRYAMPDSDIGGTSILNPASGSGPAGVTYCERLQQLEAQFGGWDCAADLETGDVTCELEESVRLLLRTLSAHAFNFVLPDLPSGVHKVTVEAKAIADSNVFSGDPGFNLGDGSAEAFVGLGSLNVDEVRFIKDSDISM